jgi:endonuclease YncB( thermonuclease family)
MRSLQKYFRAIPLILIFLFFISNVISYAARITLNVKVMEVKDGDTITVSPADGGQFFVCRLYGIDAPETHHRSMPGQPNGNEATKELKELILGQTVEVTTTGAKTYNREVCLIKKDGIDINLEMVKTGYAWAYKQYLKRPYASEFIEAEREAREKRLGLWKDNNPTPPWEFRRMMRHK